MSASDELMKSIIDSFETNDDFADRLTNIILDRISNSGWVGGQSNEYFSRRIADIVANENVDVHLSSSDTED